MRVNSPLVALPEALDGLALPVAAISLPVRNGTKVALARHAEVPLGLEALVEAVIPAPVAAGDVLRPVRQYERVRNEMKM